MAESKKEILDKLTEKFTAINQNVDIHLEGLLHAKPITYWDYIMPETLLSLQVQRSTFPDEMVFIMYHQINELLFKMILWEVDQVCVNEKPSTEFFTQKLSRISRYFDMLSSSFTIMGDGMEPEQYAQFRHTLTPASGFQSAQYRIIEFASTDLINLIDNRFRKTIDRDTPYTHAFENLYWQAAGKDFATGKKNTMLTLFEEKYKDMFLQKMEAYNKINLWQKFKSLPQNAQQNTELIKAMRHYDYTVNITWVMCHYHAAGKYLGQATATGGSDWRKYMHPKYQKRIFYPELWSEQEINNWGEDL